MSLDLPVRLARRLLPDALRQRVNRLALRLMVPRAGPSAPPAEPHQTITVAGLLRSGSGIGEGARLCAAALTRLGYAVELIDLTAFFATQDVPLPTHPAIAEGRARGPVILHVNPPFVAHALALIGRRRLARRRIVGYWAWELPRIPDNWRPSLDYVHEVWAPSRFVADAIRAAGGRPVRVVPHPVARPALSDTVAESRAAFGIPADIFVVLAIANLRSNFDRKNPLGAVRAFRAAFGDRGDVLLVLKIGDTADEPHAAEALRREIDGAANIRLMTEPLPPARRDALIIASDAVLSLHRAEGFGLVLAEAMLRGRPVIATGWSGNLDFMTPEAAALVPYRLVAVLDRQHTYDELGLHWAEPDEAAAAQWLQRLQQDPALRSALGRNAARIDLYERFASAASDALCERSGRGPADSGSVSEAR